MGIKFFYFIRGKKKFFYVVNFFLKNWNFFGSWAKLELHIVVRSWVSLGNTPFRGGLWSNGINFDDVHCYEILTRALVAMDPKKSPREKIFWQFFWSLCYETFYGKQSLFYAFCYPNRPKVLFFAISQKKNRKFHILEDFT